MIMYFSDKKYSVRNFVEIAARHIGIRIKWSGKGLNEKGIDLKTGKCIVRVSKNISDLMMLII